MHVEQPMIFFYIYNYLYFVRRTLQLNCDKFSCNELLRKINSALPQ